MQERMNQRKRTRTEEACVRKEVCKNRDIYRHLSLMTFDLFRGSEVRYESLSSDREKEETKEEATSTSTRTKQKSKETTETAKERRETIKQKQKQKKETHAHAQTSEGEQCKKRY